MPATRPGQRRPAYRSICAASARAWWHDQVVTAPIRPEDVIPDGEDNATFGGVSARKGTAAAFVANAKTLNELADGTPERDAVLAQLRALAPGLRAVGVLDVFIPRSPEIAALFAEDDKSSQ